MGKALGLTGELDEAAGILAEAARQFPGDEAIKEELARALARLDRVEEALALAQREAASSWAPAFAFRLLIRHARLAEAAAFEAAVAAADPADPDLLEIRTARDRDRPEARLRLAEAVLAHDPAAAHALYHKALALAQLGRRDEASEVMAIEAFLRVAPLPPPPGFGGEAGFQSALRGEILANPGLHPDPAGHATRFGLRTRAFPAAGDRAAPALTAAIRGAIADYAAALAGDHPFVAARPACASFTPWALVLRGAGHQRLHHHPGRWLTGVYYVGSGEAGALRIGGLPGWAGVDPPWRVIEIEPVPGTLLLFPSFVPHETVPPGPGAERISVAFDVAAA